MESSRKKTAKAQPRHGISGFVTSKELKENKLKREA